MTGTVTTAASAILAVIVALVTVLARLAYRQERDISALAQRVARLEGAAREPQRHQEDDE